MQSPEQNEAIGKIAILQLESRIKLLEQAKGWKYSKILWHIFAYSIPILFLLSRHFSPNDLEMPLLVVMVTSIVLVGRAAREANSRIDALLNLIGDEDLVKNKNA